MKNLLITLFSVFTISIASQEKNDWYLLSETGFNQVNGKNKMHFGVGAEYFISNTKSFTLRLKYFESSINYLKKGSSSGFGGFFSTSSRSFLYNGTVLSIPINYKWEKALFSSKFKFFFTSGFAINFTLKENFVETTGFTPDKEKVNLNLNFGIGLLFSINDNFNAFVSTEYFSGSAKTKEKVGFIFGSRLRTEESLFNFGIRYKLN